MVSVARFWSRTLHLQICFLYVIYQNENRLSSMKCLFHDISIPEAEILQTLKTWQALGIFADNSYENTKNKFEKFLQLSKKIPQEKLPGLWYIIEMLRYVHKRGLQKNQTVRHMIVVQKLRSWEVKLKEASLTIAYFAMVKNICGDKILEKWFYHEDVLEPKKLKSTFAVSNTCFLEFSLSRTFP